MKAVKTRIEPDKTSAIYGTDKWAKLGLLQQTKQRLEINVLEENDETMVFDLCGVEAPFANALRRILISEVATMAFEYIYIENNTSIIQDEVLSHRIGLVPLNVDPREMNPRSGDTPPTDLNTLVFRLNVTATPDSCYTTETGLRVMDVYSSDLEWVPQGNQAAKFAAKPVAPVHDDILLAQLREGQTIKLEAHAIKGIGQEHAKWSPVATASYRLLPSIEVSSAVRGPIAQELVEKCPMNVFDIEDLGSAGLGVKVARPRDCTMCRECIRGKEWEERVALTRVNDHFIFSIESTGALPAKALLVEALGILKSKALSLKSAIEEEVPDVAM